MTWSQYLAFRLGGRLASEISALGAFTQLLDALKGELSSIASSAAGPIDSRQLRAPGTTSAS